MVQHLLLGPAMPPAQPRHDASDPTAPPLSVDIAVVGGGLSGLSLCRMLVDKGKQAHLFESRDRLGGRVESVTSGAGGAQGDLGPTWFWPTHQPRISALIDALGLPHFAQHDPGDVLVLEQAAGAPRQVQAEQLHGRARRLTGGMGTLVEALAAEIPATQIHLGHVLHQVEQTSDGLRLSFDGATVTAAQLVVALPPRLVDERVRFVPDLPQALHAAQQATPTWMATQAKAVLSYSGPHWREAGYSGNAFVQHEQAVLGEIFDACDPRAGLHALGGFFAMPPDRRRNYRKGLSMLLSSQISQLFGPVEPVAPPHVRDWADEPFTCSTRDLHEHSTTPNHPRPAPSPLQDAYWDERLWFAGSETALDETGYMEGALAAAERVAQALLGSPLPISEHANRP